MAGVDFMWLIDRGDSLKKLKHQVFASLQLRVKYPLVIQPAVKRRLQALIRLSDHLPVFIPLDEKIPKHPRHDELILGSPKKPFHVRILPFAPVDRVQGEEEVLREIIQHVRRPVLTTDQETAMFLSARPGNFIVVLLSRLLTGGHFRSP